MSLEKMKLKSISFYYSLYYCIKYISQKVHFQNILFSHNERISSVQNGNRKCEFVHSS